MNDLELEGNRHLNHLMRSGVCAEGVDRILRAVRKHLGMDIAFVSHFGAADRVLKHLDSVSGGPLYQGQSIPMQEGYCLKVVHGELPECIPDTSRVPAAQQISATHAIPIGSPSECSRPAHGRACLRYALLLQLSPESHAGRA